MVVGTSHETPAFAVAAIRRWWIVVGRRRYPEARRLLIEADSGGANGCRKWAWKVALQRLADEFELDHHGDALSAGGEQVESDRSPDVQPDQCQLGRGAGA